MSMCRLFLSRRSLLAMPAALPIAAAYDVPVEPRMRLNDRYLGRLTVALTLDACPGAFDQRIAQALIKNAIPATIFATALWMRRNPAALTLLLAHRELFAIENHGALHLPPVLGAGSVYDIPVAGNLEAIDREVTGGAAAILAATSAAPSWYRGATGHYSPAAITAIRQWGCAIAGYSLNADAGASLPARSVAARIAAAATGDVIVAHINQPHRPSGSGVVAGVLELQRRGARFVRLDHVDPDAFSTST